MINRSAAAASGNNGGFFSGVGNALFQAVYQPLATTYDLEQVVYETGRSLITGEVPRDIQYASALGQAAAGGASSGQLLTDLGKSAVLAPYNVGYGLGTAFVTGDSYLAGQSVGNGLLVFGGAALGGAGAIDVSPSAIGSFAFNSLLKASDLVNAPVIPRGFSSGNAFNGFSGNLYTGLNAAGYGDTTALFQGSSVTGSSFKTGLPFDFQRTSDFDIALTGSDIFGAANDAGIPLRGGVRTGPLTSYNLGQLGLGDLAQQLSSQAGRPVNFMIYNSPATAIARSPSIPVPNFPVKKP